jgi:hypothetical protein
MCLPHATEHIVDRLKRRKFLEFAGAAAVANLWQANEARAVPTPHDPDLELEFGARMAGSAIAYTVTLHNPHQQEIRQIRLVVPCRNHLGSGPGGATAHLGKG